MGIKKILTKSYLLLIITLIVCAFFNWRISTGIILAYPFSYIQSKLITLRFSKTETGAGTFLLVFGFIIDIFVLAIPMVICGFFQEYFSFIGIFIGLIFEKYYLFFRVLVRKEDVSK